MKPSPPLPETPSGARLSNCALDETCTELDCDAVLDEFGEALRESRDGQEFLAHYCGLAYVGKLQGQSESEQ